ncbi:MAG: RDD family protein [Syntrophobacterales bacterium]|nr:RDD family protein [Syntrophobacterales bacterium]
MKVRVTDLHGLRITLSKALVRTLASCISSVIFKLGYAIQPFTSRKQTLHDLAAGTLVVNAEKDMIDSGRVRISGADSAGTDKESAREDIVASFRPTESAGISKASIWNQKRARYHAFGILGLFVFIGLLLAFSGKFGLFGPAKYDVYSCPPEQPSSGKVNLWDISTCKEVPKYTAEFRIDKASSSVYVIYEPSKENAAESSSSHKNRMTKLSNCGF